MLITQGIKLFTGHLLAYAFLPQGFVYAVCGAIIGVVFSELVGLLYLAMCFAFSNREQVIFDENKIKVTKKELIKLSLPIAIGTVLPAASQLIDSFLIVNLLKTTGIRAATATAQYGLFSGTVASIINVPVVLTLALCVAVVPIVSAGRVNRDLSGIIQKSATSIKLSYVIGVPSALLLFVLARPVLEILYPRLTAAQITLSVSLLSISAFSIIFYSQMQIYTSLLQALDKTYVPVKNLAFAVLVKVLLSVVLILKIGIIGRQ
jgi:stage V sporulation protein B